MALFKQLAELKEKLKYYEDMIPVNNMGKWARSVAIESYKKKVSKIEDKLNKRKTETKQVMKKDKSIFEITFNEWAKTHKVSTMWDNTKVENRRFIQRLNNAREYLFVYAK